MLTVADLLQLEYAEQLFCRQKGKTTPSAVFKYKIKLWHLHKTTRCQPLTKSKYWSPTIMHNLDKFECFSKVWLLSAQLCLFLVTFEGVCSTYILLCWFELLERCGCWAIPAIGLWRRQSAGQLSNSNWMKVGKEREDGVRSIGCWEIEGERKRWKQKHPVLPGEGHTSWVWRSWNRDIMRIHHCSNEVLRHGQTHKRAGRRTADTQPDKPTARADFKSLSWSLQMTSNQARSSCKYHRCILSDTAQRECGNMRFLCSDWILPWESKGHSFSCRFQPAGVAQDQ